MDMYRDDVLKFKEAVSKRGEFYVYDTETTGLNATDNDIIEFACMQVLVDEDGNYHTGKGLDVLINVGYPLPEVITNITGITDLELSTNGISSKEAVEQIRNFWGENPIIVGYNSVSFDTAFVKKLYGDSEFNYEFQLDVLTMAREKTPKPHKLVDMAEKAGITDISFHRAFDDCKATFGVLKYLLPMYQEKEPETDVSDISILGIKRWTKSHTLDRLYVSNSQNISLYLDAFTKNWFMDQNCNTELVKTKIYEFAGVTNDQELLEKYTA